MRHSVVHRSQQAYRFVGLGSAVTTVLLSVGLVIPVSVGVFVFYPIASLMIVGSFAWILRLIVRARTPTAKVLAVASLLITCFIGALVVVLTAQALHHDRLEARIREFVCLQVPPPPGGVVVSCVGQPAFNPSNGNHCGYAVTLVIDGSTDMGSLSDYYGALKPPYDIPYLTVVDPHVEQGAGGRDTNVRFLALGNPGSDPRCN